MKKNMKEVEATADMVDVLYAFEQCSQAHQPHRAQAAHGIQLKHTYNTVSHHCFSFRLAQAPLDSHLKCGHSMISLLSGDHQTILNITLTSTLPTQKKVLCTNEKYSEQNLTNKTELLPFC